MKLHYPPGEEFILDFMTQPELTEAEKKIREIIETIKKRTDEEPKNLRT